MPFARGGDNSPSNLRLLCGKHNRLEAERVYGKEKMANHAKRPLGKYVKEAGGHYAGEHLEQYMDWGKSCEKILPGIKAGRGTRNIHDRLDFDLSCQRQN